MLNLKQRSATWLAGAAALAGTFAPGAEAYTAADVCSVDIRVLYTSGGGDFFNEWQTFSITNDAPEGYLQIYPGTFTLAVDGKLCGSHSDHPSQGGSVTNAFEGITAVTITENEEDKAVTVICLDKEQHGSVDQVVAMSPIIISLTIDNNVLLVGEDATVTVGAIDPNAGEVPGQYQFAMADGSSTVTDASGSCASGSCAAVYSATSGQSGNQPFTFEVKDADFGSNGLSDTISGNIVVDNTGSIQFGLDNYHRPSGFTVSADKDELQWGEKATITITSTDEDITSSLSDALKLRGAAFTPNTLSGTTWTFPSNSEGPVTGSTTIKQIHGNQDIMSDGFTNEADNLGCHNADVAITVAKSTVGDVSTWVLEWDPWNTANSGVQADYGMTSCGFTFQAFDSKNLLSDEVTITLSATATAQDPSFDAIPMFEVIFIDDISPSRGGEVELQVHYSDSGGANQVDFELSTPGSPEMIASYTVDGGASTPWSGGPLALADGDCTPTVGPPYVSGCSHTIKLTIDGSAALGTVAANAITLKITDAVSNYADERVLNPFNVGSSRRARRESGALEASEAAQPKLSMDFNIAGGQFKAALGTPISSEGRSAGGDADGDGDGQADGGAGAGSADAGMMAGIASGSALVVIAVGALVYRRRSAAAAGANIDLGATWDSADGQNTIV